MNENIMFTQETMDKVSSIKVCLAEGVSIDDIIKKLRITEDEFFQLYELALSDEYNERIAQMESDRVNDFFNLIEKEEARIEKEKAEKERAAKERINPLSVLNDEDISQARVFAIEYSINLSEVKSYYLGSMDAIHKRYWKAFDSAMPEQAICQAIKNKLEEKGLHNVRNPRFMEPFPAYMEYQEAMKTKKKNSLIKFEMDDHLLSIAKRKIGL